MHEFGRCCDFDKRVAVARADGPEFIDADVTKICARPRRSDVQAP